MHKVLGDEQPITVRPADLLDETLDQFAGEIGDLAHNEEDVLTYALFPATGRSFPGEAPAPGRGGCVPDTGNGGEKWG